MTMAGLLKRYGRRAVRRAVRYARSELPNLWSSYFFRCDSERKAAGLLFEILESWRPK